MKRAAGLANLFSKKFLRNAAIVLVIAVVAYVVMYGVKEGFQAAGRPTRPTTPSQPQATASRTTPDNMKHIGKMNEDGYYYVNLATLANKNFVIPKSEIKAPVKAIQFEFYEPASVLAGSKTPTSDIFKAYTSTSLRTRGPQDISINVGDPLVKVNRIMTPLNIPAAQQNITDDIYINKMTPNILQILNAGKTKNDGHIRLKLTY